MALREKVKNKKPAASGETAGLELLTALRRQG
jgi:hypothetical protein